MDDHTTPNDAASADALRDFSRYVEDFATLPTLRDRVLYVLHSLPADVQQDFVEDPKFYVSVDNFSPGEGSTVFMALPDMPGDVSRSVVLKPLLDRCTEPFAHYVIAHEFAHAFLRNGPWGDITDVEEAADSLAAHWGYPRPAKTPWN